MQFTRLVAFMTIAMGAFVVATPMDQNVRIPRAHSVLLFAHAPSCKPVIDSSRSETPMRLDAALALSAVDSDSVPAASVQSLRLWDYAMLKE
ncbi:hypothetical protein RhiJN_25094 [Ceratobasidium sp. AG-Ba]|nr:hypothetical protein RhiJN_25094 [Ceratobasidium sp. AG-Ba]